MHSEISAIEFESHKGMSVKLEPKFITSEQIGSSRQKVYQEINSTKSESWHRLEKSNAISPASISNVKNMAYVG